MSSWNTAREQHTVTHTHTHTAGEKVDLDLMDEDSVTHRSSDDPVLPCDKLGGPDREITHLECLHKSLQEGQQRWFMFVQAMSQISCYNQTLRSAPIINLNP